MKKLDEYLVPLSGVAIIFLVMYRNLMGFGSPGLGMLQIVLILVGIAISIVGFKLKIRPIYFCKTLLNVDRRTLSYIVAISVFLFLCIDLLLGRIYPKMYTPTKYGWSVAADRKVIHTVQDTKDNYRKVTNQYFAHGFKRWPIDPGDKPRVLIIGDSFTQMTYVSNGEEWYAYIEQAFSDIVFYVFGGGGYGTLQEYMVMDDHFDNINPDAIIWQFCGNDYANNYYELDKRGYPFNNHFVRPYLENNDIVFRLPLPYPQLREYSFLADRLLHIYDRKHRRDATKDLSEYRKRRDKKRNSLSLQDKRALELDNSKAVDVTKILVEKVRSRSGDIPIYFFNSCGKFTDNHRSICDAGGFRCVDDIGDYMKKIEDSGIQTKIENDGHWNYSGNQYAGEKLAEYLTNIWGVVVNKRHQ